MRPSEGPDLRGWRGVLLAVRFLTELALLVVLVVAGASLGKGPVASVAFAIVGPALAIAIWSPLLALRSRHRLPDPARLIVELVLFLGAAAALAAAGHPASAGVFAVVAVAVAVLVRVYVKES